MPSLTLPRAILAIGHYAAPAGKIVRPFEIAEGHEVVELLTDGCVYFPGKDGEETKYGKGAIFWHEAGEWTVWKTSKEEPYRCLAIHFEVTQKHRPAPRVSCWLDTSTLGAFVREAIQLGHDNTFDPKVAAAYLYTRLVYESQSGLAAQREDGYPEPLLRALKKLRNDLDRPLSIPVLAEVAQVSEPYLFHLFKTHLNESPHQCLIRARLQEARVLLASNDMEIREVARRCGFDNVENFCRAFRREVGMPPGAFRRQQQRNRQ